jgi:hypothetical protein
VVLMDLQDEIRMVFDVYRATGKLPEQPDRALLPKAPAIGPSGWFERLSPRDQQRMRQAIDQGARNGAYAGAWTERD